MGGKLPQTIMTDQDGAIGSAVDHVFYGVQHRLCLWHICENAKKNIKGLMCIESFSKMFYRCLYHCATASEFYDAWSKMLGSFNCCNVGWLKNLYAARFKWCPALCKHVFSAGNFTV